MRVLTFTTLINTAPGSTISPIPIKVCVSLISAMDMRQHSLNLVE